jgi:folate-binding protein YgfZ
MTSMNAAAKAKRDSVLSVLASDRAGIVVRGKDRLTWLNGLVTCDLAKLGRDAAAYGLVVEKKGRITTDFYAVPATSDDALVLAVPRELAEATAANLDHYLVMEDAELETAELVVWQLAGPRARDVAFAVEARFAGVVSLLAGEGAIVAAPRSEAVAFADRLAARVSGAGGIVTDEGTWDALRIESGVPRFGVEVDASLYPQEASLERLAVSFDKGCYLGQEVVYMLENRGHVKRKLVTLDIDGSDAAPRGASVTTPDGAAVGDVKSSTVGLDSGRPVAIAMVKWAQSKAGTELKIGARAARVR